MQILVKFFNNYDLYINEVYGNPLLIGITDENFLEELIKKGEE